MKADLHIHSNVSDGSSTIEEIIQMAEDKGLDAIAITDHDTLAQVSRFPNGTRLKLISGLEISAVDKRTSVKAHIMGYSIKKPEYINALTQPLLEARNRNSEKQAEILKRHGYIIDIEQMNKADGKYLYKQHIMDWLVSTGQVLEMFGDFYQSIFKNNGICDFDINYIDAAEAVRAIKKAGGIAVLAHPGQQQNYFLIPILAKIGLNGLEVNHSANSENDKTIIREYAKKYNLFLTGGSDYHGKFDHESVEIGDFLAEESGIKAICL